MNNMNNMNNMNMYTISSLDSSYLLIPSMQKNKEILKQNDITSNWGYRRYIQNHANQIMKYNTMESIYASGIDPHYSSSMNSTIPSNPYLYNSTYDYNYTSNISDLKRDFLQKEQLKSRMFALKK